MEMKKLGTRQLFLMKRDTLEKKMLAYFEATKDSDTLIQYLVAVMVRHALHLTDAFSFLCKDVLRDILLSTEPTETMRLFMPLFKDYFNENEWEMLIKKMYRNESNYFQQTQEMRRLKNLMEKAGTLSLYREGLVYHIESFFVDALGKRHKLTIREVDPNKEEMVVVGLLSILTKLTIFEVDGVRKFVAFVNYKGGGNIETTAYDTRKEATKEENGAEEGKQKVPSVVNPQKKQPRTNHSDGQTSATALVAPTVTSEEIAPDFIETDAPPMAEDLTKSSKSTNRLPAPDTSYMRTGKSDKMIKDKRKKRKQKLRIDKELSKKKKGKKKNKRRK